MIKIADVTDMFKPDWATILEDVKGLDDRLVLGDWGGWGVMTNTGHHREGFGYGFGPDIKPPTSYTHGLKHLTWSSAAKPSIKAAVEQVRRKGLFPSRVRITTLDAHGKIGWHSDTPTPETSLFRLHFILQTNPLALFESRDTAWHLKEHHVYLFDANHEHRIVNNGEQVRIHLMMDIRMSAYAAKISEGRWYEGEPRNSEA